MKKILVPTDFSLTAENAARYAVHLAKTLKAGIKLFNAFMVPAEVPLSPEIPWPSIDFPSIKKDTLLDLDALAVKLKKEESKHDTDVFMPMIECGTEIGNITDLAGDMIVQERIKLAVLGMSGAGSLPRFFLGSTSRDMIDKANFPVLLIPPRAIYKKCKKIAFATDLNPADINVIQSLASLACYYNAEILISHITDNTYEELDGDRAKDFLNEITGKINYSRIYYRHIKSMDVDHGLDWLTEHGNIDMLAMVHRKHNLLKMIFGSSHTQRIARHIAMPLLVYPDAQGPVAWPVF